ncbi:MAG: transcription antitermination factor NusB [Candidatus Izemoplasmatales bacterium]|jgi:N utilization substance protein B|nr:transcription antitermination factor NusB [Candidatus Izemoplasmatales bacterium]
MKVSEMRQLRDDVVKLLYLSTMGGSYDRADYSETVNARLDAVLAELDNLDQIISNQLKNWTIDRLNYVDLAIVRYAVYEMKYMETPPEIAINEALELTKKYSNLDDDNAKSFNNRLLQNIKDNLG